MNFVNLNTITCYSTLKSTIKIPELIQVAKKRGYWSLAITDFNVLHGTIQFYDQCIQNNLKPIIGMTLGTRGFSDMRIKLVLLAENKEGYKNLLKISTLINIDSNFQTLESLKDYYSGLTVIISPTENEIIESNFEKINEMIGKYRKLFSNLYLGYSPSLMNLSKMNIYEKIYQQKLLKIVYMDEVKYLNAEDEVALKILEAIDKQEKIDPEDPLLTVPGSHELKSASEVVNPEKGDLFDAVTNANNLAKELNVEIVKEKTELPHFKSSFDSSSKYLKHLVSQGLTELGKDQDPEYLKRVEYELKVIDEMGFADYFLIIWDIVNYANSADIQLGAGRGSAAGSLVSYTLGISKVDPIEYGLLFERFLNPARVNMPDIDLDVPDDKRGEIIKYLQQKYGRDNFAQIITFSTLGVKQGIRDCLRVFSADNKTVSRWINAVPHGLHVTLKQCYSESSEFQKLVNEDKFGRMLFSVLLKIEGLPRQPSIHAAGVVISENKLVDKIPLQEGANDILLTQYVYHDVEELGLLKIDILGLRNLTILKKMIDLVHKYDDPNFKVEQIDNKDPLTLKVFHDADTDGVFQFESDGLKRVLLKMDVESFNDIVATNALFRPGPMGQINTYIEHKKNKDTSYDPDLAPLKPIIDSTYGVIVYQEQVMQAANLMAGFPLSEADMLRRAMSKKNRALLDEYQTKFIDGAVQKGYSEKQAKKVYDLIEYFSNYGFNKSHSVAYSMLAFWLGYIKSHFPIHFFTVQLEYSLGDYTRLRNLINAAKRKNIRTISPEINTSIFNFTNDGKKIISGLVLIKDLRRDFIKEVVSKRFKYGSYKDLNDLLNRVDRRFLKDDNFLPLIRSGACDDFPGNRRELVENLKTSIDSIVFSQNNVNLFEQLKPRWDPYPDFSYDEKIEMEHELTGLYLNGSPFDEFKNLEKIYQPQKINQLQKGKKSWIFATIVKKQVIKDKNGKQMSFISLDDMEDVIEGVIFSDQYFEYSSQVIEGKKIAAFGQIRDRRGINFIINKMFLLKEASKTFNDEKLFVEVSEIDSKKMKILQQLFAKNHGLNPVYIVNNKTGQNVLLNPNSWVSMSEELYHELIQLVGNKHVIFQEKK
ncbi:DNA polymerase III subunit alpha [Xylocopilactobacillus apis]|uniref:DNA polymerase III subunit alpha n=1 Tax=Xylocopilactobacillus apis TaxID=2932183 RepID=A0AAU9D713_9LACO|nr:DNA polymerase III subunit alpha [Xylocopilactobacillus apis]BDR56552.1 DNA-directed DNA polymerase [Xylocopilactobacillus apis]